MKSSLIKIRSIADYQFGKNAGITLFPKDVKISYSKSTGRIRFIFLNNKRLATLRPTDGLFSISIEAGKILERNKDGRDYMTLKVERDEGVDSSQDSELSVKIGKEVKKQILVSANIEIVKYGALPRSERKSKRVFDHRDE